MRKITLLISLTLLLFTQCKKDETPSSGNATVQGYVIDAWNDDTVKTSFKIELWEGRIPGTHKIEAFDKIISTSTSNKDGFYKINFQASTDFYYCVRPVPNNHNYILHESGNSFGYHPSHGIKNRDLSVYPKTWISMRIKNTEIINSTDTFIYGNYYSSPIDTIIGYADTTILIEHTPLLSNASYFYDIINEKYNDRFFFNANSCPSFDTCTITINY